MQIFASWSVISLSRFGVEEFVETGQITKSFWARSYILLASSIVILATSYFWMPWLAGWLKISGEFEWVILAYFLTMAFWTHVQHALNGGKLMQSQGVLFAVERIIILVAFLILIATDSLKPMSALLVYTVSPLIVSIIGLYLLRKLISLSFSFDRAWIAKLLRFSFPLIFAFFLLNLSNNYIDAIFISQFLTKKDLGIYSIAFQFYGMFMQLPLLAGTLILQLFITLNSSKQSDKVETFMELILPIITVTIGLGLSVGIPIVAVFIQFAFVESSNEISSLYSILALSTVFAAPFVIGFIPYINSMSASRYWSIFTLIAATINIVGDYYLIPKFGLYGCAWTTFMAQGIAFVFTTVLIVRKFSLSFSWTIPATIPVTVGTILGYVFSNITLGIFSTFVLTAILIMIYKKSFLQGITLIKNYRRFLTLQEVTK